MIVTYKMVPMLKVFTYGYASEIKKGPTGMVSSISAMQQPLSFSIK